MAEAVAVWWGVLRVVVIGYRLAHALLWQLVHRLRMAVVGERGAAEDDKPAKRWQDALLASRHGAIPKLQVSTVLFWPVVIQVLMRVKYGNRTRKPKQAEHEPQRGKEERDAGWNPVASSL